MRKKVRKSLAFLLALALVVSVMSGLGLSVSADETVEESPVAMEEEQPVEEAPKAEEKEEKTAEPAAEPEKKDEEKAEGEGSGDKEEEPKAPVSNDVEEEEKKDEEQEQADPSEEKQLSVMANGATVSQYTVSYNNETLTVKLVDGDGKSVQGVAPTLEIKANEAQDVKNFVATVEGYTYSSAYYNSGRNKPTVSQVAYYNQYEDWRTYNGWYSVSKSLVGATRNKITENKLYLVYEKNASFTIHYVDENGKEIADSKTQDAADEVTFTDYKVSIAGYTYWRACYSTANNAEITKAVKSSYNKYTFYNGSTALTTSTNGHYVDEEISTLKDIYLVYVKDGVAPTPGGTTGGSGSSIGEPSHTKKALLQRDGTYDLSLDVSASVGSAASKAILDVVFILDTSGSMSETISGSYTTKKITSATDAIKAMVNSLAANDKIDAQFSLVTFATNAKQVGVWTSDANTLNKALPSEVDGGTNYQDAFIKGKAFLDTSRTNATKVVVFVSDGNPTFYLNKNSDVNGTGLNDTTGRGMSNARGIVKSMLPNYLFTVGVGDPNEYSNLSQITDAAHPGVTKQNYEGKDTTTLKAAFNDMEGQITSIACADVTISDKLSGNVTITMDGDKPKKLESKVTDKNGNPVGTYNSADGSITLPATDLNAATTLNKPTYENGEIVWNLPSEYKLEADYTYTVIANIEVTETAFENYRRKNGYPDTADAGTGTHEKQKGLFSNDNNDAKLTYTVTGDSTSKTVNYPKPVVQLTPSKLTIKKTVTGLDDTALEQLKNGLKFKVTYTYKDKTTTEKEISFKDFTLSDGTYSYTSDTLDCWSMDATYTVVEDGFVVEGYDRTNSDTTVTGQILGKNQAVTATFTNAYTPSNRTITLRKIVTGNMGDKNQSFTFSATKATLETTSLKHDQTTTITAKVGDTVTITETNPGNYTVSADGVNGGTFKGNSYTFKVTKDMNKDTVITFTNTLQINPPAGIITTIAPYAIMVVLAAGAGVYFVYSRRRHNG